MSGDERRAPRVMHGGHRLFAQARDLSKPLADLLASLGPAPGPTPAPTPAPAVPDALPVLLRRLAVAELRVRYVMQAVENFRKQAEALPADHPLRGAVNQMLDTVLELLEAAERDTPK